MWPFGLSASKIQSLQDTEDITGLTKAILYLDKKAARNLTQKIYNLRKTAETALMSIALLSSSESSSQKALESLAATERWEYLLKIALCKDSSKAKKSSIRILCSTGQTKVIAKAVAEYLLDALLKPCNPQEIFMNCCSLFAQSELDSDYQECFQTELDSMISEKVSSGCEYAFNWLMMSQYCSMVELGDKLAQRIVLETLKEDSSKQAEEIVLLVKNIASIGSPRLTVAAKNGLKKGRKSLEDTFFSLKKQYPRIRNLGALHNTFLTSISTKKMIVE